MARTKTKRNPAVEPGSDGFWDRPALINLVADALLVLAVTGLTWAASSVLPPAGRPSAGSARSNI